MTYEEEKKMQEAMRRVRQAGIEAPTSDFKEEQVDSNINANAGNAGFDGSLLPKDYQFGAGAQADAQADDGVTVPAPTYGGYDEMIKIFHDAEQGSRSDAEDAKRQERLARVHSFTGGLGDLGRALSNMYFTTRYAPNGYDHSKESMSEKAKARADKWRQERQRLQKEYYNYAMQGANAKQAKETAQHGERVRAASFAEQRRQFNETMRQKERDQERKDAELEMKQKKQEVWEQMKRGDLNVKELNAWTRQMEAKSRQSRADINHNLASYTETTTDIYDDHHRKIGTKKVRLVVNPKTGDLEVKEEIVSGGGGGNRGGGDHRDDPFGNNDNNVTSGQGDHRNNPFG